MAQPGANQRFFQKILIKFIYFHFKIRTTQTFVFFPTRMGKDLNWQKLSATSGSDLKFGLSPSKKNCFIYFNESLSKVTKNAFYFTWKALFVLKIFLS